MLALIFFMLLVDGNEQKSCREIRNFNSPGSSLVSYPLTQSRKQVSYFEKICRFNLSWDNHENDNDLTKINTRNQIYPLNKYRGRNVTGKDLDKWSRDSYEIWFLLSRSCDLFNCANVRITYSNSRSQTRRWIECHSSLTSHPIEFLVCKSALQLSTNHLVLHLCRRKGTLAVD